MQECSSRGATAAAACTRGVAYVPAGQRAAATVQADPEKSNCAIADELGGGSNTVRRARAATAPNGAVSKRIGRNGKARRAPRKRTPKPEQEEPGIEDDIAGEDPVNDRPAFLSRVDAAIKYPTYAGTRRSGDCGCSAPGRRGVVHAGAEEGGSVVAPPVAATH